MKRTASAVMFMVLLNSLPIFALNIQPVQAEGGIIFIRADGSVDPPTAPIYTADNITYNLTGNIMSDSDGIVIERDNVVLNGAGYTVTGSGTVALERGNGTTLTSRSNVTIRNMTIRNFHCGICLYSSSNSTLSGNNVTANNLNGVRMVSSSNNTLSGNNVENNGYGIWLVSCDNNVLSGNNVTNNWAGIWLRLSCKNNVLSGNMMVGNRYTFVVLGYVLSDFMQSIDTSNLIDGKPVYYFINQSDMVVNASAYPEVGYLGLVNCVNMTVQGLNCQGLMLAFTNDSKITGNTVVNNFLGIFLAPGGNNILSGNNVTNNQYGIYIGSSNNILSGNNVTNNWVGIYLFSFSGNILSGNNVTANDAYGIWLASSNNFIFHNSLVNNTNQIYTEGSSNTWDNGFPSGGNYWSDYNGTDSYTGRFQNETGSDGIGDQHYVIDTNNTDHYPFMEPNGWENYPLPFETNMTVTDRTIRTKAMFFNVTGQSGQVGYVNVTVPVGFNATEIEVFVDGRLMEPPFPVITTNSTHYFIYFEIALSTHKIAIHYGLVADISGTTLGVPDGTVNMRDVSYMVVLFNTRPSSPNWNPNADVNGDDTVNMRDISIAILNFNKHE